MKPMNRDLPTRDQPTHDQPWWVQAAVFFPGQLSDGVGQCRARSVAKASMGIAFVLAAAAPILAALGHSSLLLLALFFGLGVWQAQAIQWMDLHNAWRAPSDDREPPVRGNAVPVPVRARTR